jgi:thiosulfate/3-mercaptopyruvate sulfurtransferase
MRWRRFALLAAPSAVALSLALAVSAASASGPQPVPWTSADLLDPAQLAARFRATGAAKPKILYVGFGILYRSKHIPDAVFAGPTAKQEGLQLLRAAVLKEPRNEEVIIYCGCCPWDHCPNLRPAFLMLRELGFKRIKVLSLPTSFYKDWIEKGYPVELGHS